MCWRWAVGGKVRVQMRRWLLQAEALGRGVPSCACSLVSCTCLVRIAMGRDPSTRVTRGATSIPSFSRLSNYLKTVEQLGCSSQRDRDLRCLA